MAMLISPLSLSLCFRSGFSQHENRKLLKSALAILAGRLKEKENEVDLGMEELVR